MTNTITGRFYIGVTTAPKLQRRLNEHFNDAMYGRHNGAFHHALRKHPKHVFKIEPLISCGTVDDGLREEMRQIALRKPEYNSTPGGEGSFGCHLTAEGREKIRQTHLGNKYRLGKTHTAETRLVLRGHAIKGIESWKRFAAMGPKSIQRSVLCIDDGKVYPSATSAAEAYGVAKSALIELCLGQRYRKTVGGLRFAYVSKTEAA